MKETRYSEMIKIEGLPKGINVFKRMEDIWKQQWHSQRSCTRLLQSALQVIGAQSTIQRTTDTWFFKWIIFPYRIRSSAFLKKTRHSRDMNLHGTHLKTGSIKEFTPFSMSFQKKQRFQMICMECAIEARYFYQTGAAVWKPLVYCQKLLVLSNNAHFLRGKVYFWKEQHTSQVNRNLWIKGLLRWEPKYFFRWSMSKLDSGSTYGFWKRTPHFQMTSIHVYKSEFKLWYPIEEMLNVQIDGALLHGSSFLQLKRNSLQRHCMFERRHVFCYWKGVSLGGVCSSRGAYTVWLVSLFIVYVYVFIYCIYIYIDLCSSFKESAYKPSLMCNFDTSIQIKGQRSVYQQQLAVACPNRHFFETFQRKVWVCGSVVCVCEIRYFMRNL